MSSFLQKKNHGVSKSPWLPKLSGNKTDKSYFVLYCMHHFLKTEISNEQGISKELLMGSIYDPTRHILVNEVNEPDTCYSTANNS